MTDLLVYAGFVLGTVVLYGLAHVVNQRLARRRIRRRLYSLCAAARSRRLV